MSNPALAIRGDGAADKPAVGLAGSVLAPQHFLGRSYSNCGLVVQLLHGAAGKLQGSRGAAKAPASRLPPPAPAPQRARTPEGLPPALPENTIPESAAAVLLHRYRCIATYYWGSLCCFLNDTASEEASVPKKKKKKYHPVRSGADADSSAPDIKKAPQGRRERRRETARAQ